MSDNKPTATPPWAKPNDEQSSAPQNDAEKAAAEAQAKLEAELKEQAEAQAKLEAEAKAKLEAQHNVPLAAAANAAKDKTVSDEPVVMVTVTVPQNYNLRLDDHTVVPYKTGIQEMPLEHAEHWWSKQNGVVEYNPKKPE